MSAASAFKRLFTRPFDKVGPAEAAELVDGGAILLDVRDRHEWQAGHAPKARHIPLAQLADRAKELPVGRPIVTVCRSGARSSRAATMLGRDGRQVWNLSGGMHAWARADLPVIATGGRPGRIA